MAIDKKTLVSSKNYTNQVALGIGSMRVENTTVYFTITDTGEEVAVTLPTPKDGTAITNVDVDSDNYLVCTFSDGSIVKSAKPIEIKVEGVAESNINSISVNGQTVKPDSKKNVNINIPDAPIQSISQDGKTLTIDSNGNVNIPIADTNKIEKIKVNNTELPINENDKSVNITVTNGKDGKDGADGAKGDKGDKGDTGDKGEKGDTPIKGTDYWTESDKKEIVDEAIEEIKEIQPTFIELTESDILEKVGLSDEELEGLSTVISDSETRTDKTWSSSKVYGEVNKVASGILSVNEEIAYLKAQAVQQTPLFAESVEWLNENGDTSKVYVLPDGYIYGYFKTEKWEQGYTNLLPTSTISGGGEIYNSTGYKINVRLNSSGTEKDQTGGFVTGFIPITKNSVLRVKHFASGKYANFNVTGNAILLYNSSYTLLTTAQQGTGSQIETNNIGTMDDTTGIYTVTVSDILDDDSISFVRVSTIISGNISVSATDEHASKVVITVDEEIGDGIYVTTYAWGNTGISFSSGNYDETVADHERRLTLLEAADNSVGVPEYWLEHLEEKANDIQIAVENAGRNKSAFLWYTDAHWTSSSKMSPSLLKYLVENTPINKVNFGGDIVGDPIPHIHDNIKYVYEWRKLISGLPNHHSVYGNHDVYHRTEDVSKMAYGYILAPEETAEMVIGGDSYYYIDNPSEKTRYLYLSYFTTDTNAKIEQGKFIVEALKSTSEDWHIVVIAHRWWQYSSTSNPTVGSVPAYEGEILSIFDAYNAKTTRVSSTSFAEQDFTTAKGKVEFCIGGHIHVDYDFTSTGGIPVVITTADTNQNRVPDIEIDSGTAGTITESAVFGIIADYDNGKITVVGVGRGTSREITLTT